MKRLIAYFRSLPARYTAWQLQRVLSNVDSELRARRASISRYVDGGPVWLEMAGHRFYFEGTEEPFTITTYEPEERKRKLVKTNYRV